MERNYHKMERQVKDRELTPQRTQESSIISSRASWMLGMRDEAQRAETEDRWGQRGWGGE